MSVTLLEIGSPAFEEIIKTVAVKATEIGIELGKRMAAKPVKDEREWVRMADALRITKIKTRQGLRPYLVENGTYIKGKIRFRKHKTHLYAYKRQDCEDFENNKYN